MANIKTKNLTLAGLFLALSIIMPKLIHFLGPQAGKMMLPLFWGIGISALILPLKYSFIIAVLTPVISYLVSGMPSVPLLYFMIIEFVVYAATVTFIHKKINAPLSILLGLFASRSVYILSLLLAANVFKITVMPAGFIALLTSTLFSIPGIVAQLIIAPAIEKLYKSSKLYE